MKIMHIFLLAELITITSCHQNKEYELRQKELQLREKEIQLREKEISIKRSELTKLKDIDGIIYRTVIIGEQNWMAENLNVSRFKNGDPIPQARSSTEWIELSHEFKPAWCYYDFDTSFKKFGKLYNWYTVNDPRGLAPEGWNVPSDKECLQLINFLGGEDSAGVKMKSPSSWWEGNNNNALTNSSGFSALPGGQIEIRNSYHFGRTGFWWSSTDGKVYNSAWSFELNTISEGVFTMPNDLKCNGESVRCLENLQHL